MFDAGYSLKRPERFWDPVRELKFAVTYVPADHQRGIKGFDGDALLIDGCFYSKLLPRELQGVDAAGNNAPLPFADYRTSETVDPLELPLNERALWMFTLHQGPDAQGRLRLRCPFHAGRLRCPQVPFTMRFPHEVPLRNLDGGPYQCCTNSTGIMTVSKEDALLWQRVPPGTTAGRLIYGRRNNVESGNSGLRGQYINIDRTFSNVFGLTKSRILLAFSLAGFNLDRIDTYLVHRQMEETTREAKRRHRRSRRAETGHPATD
jgi:hypothetical protein